MPSLAEFLEKYSLRGVRAYLVAAIAMTAVTALRVALNPVLGDAAPYAFQAIVLLPIAALAGHKPSLFALVVALVLGWFLIPPYAQSTVQKIGNEITTGIAGLMICLITSTMRSALITALLAQREANLMGLEMHHRVKNLFAVVASMITLAERDQPKAREVLVDLRTRLQSLADAHDVAINPAEFISLPDLVNRLMAPHKKTGSEHGRVQVIGEPVNLPAGHTTPLGLIINELATNAAKHGALAHSEGRVRISWVQTGELLDFRWEELGPSVAGRFSEPDCTGFGSLLLQASVAQLRGRIARRVTDEGLVVHISIPTVEESQNMFRSNFSADTQSICIPPQSSLSALRDSKRFLLRRFRIRDSRS